MRRVFLPLVVMGYLISSPIPARADFWGADIPLLIQIVANTIQQLVKLKEIIDTGRQQIELVQEINRGINDSLALVRTVFPNMDPGTYRNWETTGQAANGLSNIYGAVTDSPEATVQRDADQSVAEAITLNNSVYRYTRDVDEIGEAIKAYSHQTSPGGAQKLTAQGIGVLLNVMNQGLRIQATGLKLQAQSLALDNKRQKDGTRQLLTSADTLRDAMKTQDTSYALPRF